MKKVFGYKALVVAIAGLAMNANGAGLDRSGQDMTAFLQDGTYAEVVYTYMNTNVSGHDNGVVASVDTSGYVKGNATGNITEKYDFFRYGVKADINDRFSVGVIYDEPFGAAVQHQDGGTTHFVGRTLSSGMTPEMVYQGALANVVAAITDPTAKTRAQTAATMVIPSKTQAETTRTDLLTKKSSGVLSAQEEQLLALSQAALGLTDATLTNQGQGTNVDIQVRNVAGLLGAKLGPIQVYGGAAAQRLGGEVHLRGSAYSAATGYDASIAPHQAVGWVAGVAYSKPEIALKAALTYRSAIEHKAMIAEVFPALGTAGVTTRDFNVKTPESYNLDFQTGVNPTTLLTAKVRYVPWSKFEIRTPTYGDATATRNSGVPLPMASYSKDQWSGEIGLGKKISDKLSLAGNIGYDSGAGNPTTSLGPVAGYYSVGAGFKYNITPTISASVGAKYLKFNDAYAQLPNGMIVGNFENNDGFVAGVKLAYQAK